MTSEDVRVHTVVRRARLRAHGEEGVTLVELLVSMAILAIVLTAFAGSIMVTLRAITTTEHEVIVTQFVAEVSESIQVGDFEYLALYEDEIDPAVDPDAATWEARTDTAGKEFDGNPLILTTGPGADRDDRIPEPFVTGTRGGLDIRVDRYVTWVDSDGDGIVETKRLTSFASWTDRSGEPRELRFESERVPTQAEASADVTGRRVIDFRFSPDPVELTPADGRTSETVTVTVRTNVATEFGALQVYEYDQVFDVWRLQTLLMSPGEPAPVGWVTWTATVPGVFNLSNGQVDFLFTGREVGSGSPGSREFIGIGTLDTFGGPYDYDHPTPGVDFVDGDPPTSGDPDPDPTADPGPDVAVSVTSAPIEICVDSSTWVNTAPLVFDVETRGLDADDGDVTITYPYYSSQPTKGNGSPKPNAPPSANAEDSFALTAGDESSATWQLTIPATSRIFNPVNYRDVTFEITAERNGGAFATDTDVATLVLTTRAGC